MVDACYHPDLTVEENAAWVDHAVALCSTSQVRQSWTGPECFCSNNVSQPLQPSTVVGAFSKERSPKHFTEAIFPMLPAQRQEVNNLWYILGSKVALAFPAPHAHYYIPSNSGKASIRPLYPEVLIISQLTVPRLQSIVVWRGLMTCCVYTPHIFRTLYQW